MRAAGIVVAAGSGLRLGAGVPKALVQLGGRPLVGWAVETLQSAGIADVVAVVPASQRAAFTAVLPADVRVVAGGDTRIESVRAGLAAIGTAAIGTAAIDPVPTAVLVHDAARPLTPPAVVVRVLDALARGALAVVPVLPVVDTIAVVDGTDGVVTGDVPRDRLRRVQTPQGFHLPTLVAAYGRLAGGAAAFTDDASVVRAAGTTVHTVAGDERAAKITVARDLLAAEREVAR